MSHMNGRLIQVAHITDESEDVANPVEQMLCCPRSAELEDIAAASLPALSNKRGRGVNRRGDHSLFRDRLAAAPPNGLERELLSPSTSHSMDRRTRFVSKANSILEQRTWDVLYGSNLIQAKTEFAAA
ncbi:MAG: hypothetical protein Q9192_001941 [Flavoplaca navasiana]